MQYFQRIRSGIVVQPLLDSVAEVDAAWDLQTGRQEKVRVQREAQAIPLRGLRKTCLLGRARRDVQESRWTTGSKRFPLLRHMLQTIAEDLDTDLGRAKLVMLPAGRRVYPHIDRGRYYQLHDRYHLVLKSVSGSWLRAGDEEVRMREGELWWFDNRQIHEAYNDGTEDRIHLIFDLLPPAKRVIAQQQFLAAQQAFETSATETRSQPGRPSRGRQERELDCAEPSVRQQPRTEGEGKPRPNSAPRRALANERAALAEQTT